MLCIEEIKLECERLECDCLYTSTSLYIWLRSIRRWNKFFLIFAALSGLGVSFNSLLNWTPSSIQALLIFVLGALPSVGKALGLEQREREITRIAAEYKNLQRRFRQTRTIASACNPDNLSGTFEQLMRRLEDVNSHSVTAPERCFKKAQAKIKRGDYKT